MGNPSAASAETPVPSGSSPTGSARGGTTSTATGTTTQRRRSNSERPRAEKRAENRIKRRSALTLIPGIVSDRFISRIWWLSSCVAAAAAPTAALPTSLPNAEEFGTFFSKKFKKIIVLCLGEEDPSVVGEMAIGHDRWSDLCQWGLCPC